MNPEYGSTYRLLGWTYHHDAVRGWSESPGESLKKAEELANKALSLGDDGVYHLLAVIYMHEGQWEKAVEIGEKGLTSNSNWANYNLAIAAVFRLSGRYEEALALLKKAMRLNPKHPPFYLRHLGHAYVGLKQYDKAIPLFKKNIELMPNDIFCYTGLIEAYVGLNREKEAREVAKEVLKLNPKFSIAKYLRAIPYKNGGKKGIVSNSLRRAGLPYDSPLQQPVKPSIAVLAFENMSGDPEQEYFSDGITDDLITDLSKISGLFVVARNSTFSFKGQHKKVQQIGKELGVRYVLEGSVRKYEDKVRINAQLIDAQTGGHLWAERYDRNYREIFALQDEVINNIVSILSVKLTEGEEDLIGNQKTVNMKAYDYYLKGMNILHTLTARQSLKVKKYV